MTLEAPLRPPIAAKKAHSHPSLRGPRPDPWAWMESEEAELAEYLQQENAFASELIATFPETPERFAAELQSAVPPITTSPPSREGRWVYYSRTDVRTGRTVHCRQPWRGRLPTAEQIDAGRDEGTEQEVLDTEALPPAPGGRLGGWQVDPTGRLVAYLVDPDGGERYALFVRDLDGSVGSDDRPVAYDCMPGLVWHTDAEHLVFVSRHRQGKQLTSWSRLSATVETVATTSAHADRLSVRLSNDRLQIIVTHQTSTGTTVSSLARRHGRLLLRPVGGWPPDIAVEVEHHATDGGGGDWIVASGPRGGHLELIERTDLPDQHRTSPMFRCRADESIDGFRVFRDFLAVSVTGAGCRRILSVPFGPGAEAGTHVVDQSSLTSWIFGGRSVEHERPLLTYGRCSLTEPPRSVQIDLHTRDRRTVDGFASLPGYLQDDYLEASLEARADDGESVPITLVCRRSVRDRGDPAPCLLNVYGSYGASIGGAFSPSRLPLLDRGWIWAYAHVRGGGERGPAWHHAGRGLAKPRSIGDLAAVIGKLVSEGITSSDLLALRGRSAGATLVAATLNDSPGRCGAAVLEFPYLDCLSSLERPDPRYAVADWREFGNPNAGLQSHDRIASWSPYDNITRHRYPAIYICAALNDERTPPWHAAKWVARLRDQVATHQSPVLRVVGSAGHLGPVVPADSVRLEAEIQAFLAGHIRRGTE
ncbi:S9 family peptidase [Pimelobacter simplex]|uniref:S9 family peptidase n=1 Tax=Nocardioides simplex TaxID=2045 RepID=A0A7J5E3Z8_NOCSI|nr:prolyl oligopeptidase family serine peptidase [Pimelobacter simplex]KAB2812958.1 S9 family peptidase [Pimelobacter simplex]